MFKEEGFQTSFGPEVHGIGQQLHRDFIDSKKIPDEHNSLQFLEEKDEKLKTTGNLLMTASTFQIRAAAPSCLLRHHLSLCHGHIVHHFLATPAPPSGGHRRETRTSLTAHMRAMDPMLLVMVTSVAFARSSRDTSSRFRLLIMLPKLSSEQGKFTHRYASQKKNNGLATTLSNVFIATVALRARTSWREFLHLKCFVTDVRWTRAS